MKLFRKVIVFAMFLLSVSAQERIVLDAPVLVDPGVTRVAVANICMNYIEGRVTVALHEVDANGGWVLSGKRQEIVVSGENARTLMHRLNTLDMSTISAKKRILSYLQQIGQLGTGSVTGDPQP